MATLARDPLESYQGTIDQIDAQIDVAEQVSSTPQQQQVQVAQNQQPRVRQTRSRDLDVTDTVNSIEEKIKTIAVEDLPDGISIMKNGWPNWGLRNRDLKILEGYSSLYAPYINTIFSMLNPYVSLKIISDEQEEDNSLSADEWFMESELDLSAQLFSNSELMQSISQPITKKDELGFLSFGKNILSIKNLNIDIEETTGLYSVKRFKFVFVAHRFGSFDNDIIKNILNPNKKFILTWGYNLDLTNSDLLSKAKRIASILGSQNKETISFSSWDIKQEDSDQNIEISAEAIPISSKSYVTIKMGEHRITSAETITVLESYQNSLETMENVSGERESRAQEKTKNNIQGKINAIIISAFESSMSLITKNKSDGILFKDILDEISACINYSFKKNNYKGIFKFVCGKINDSIGTSDDYIGNFKITNEAFSTFITKIKKSKNIPHALEFLDNVIAEFISDYEDFRSVSENLNKILTKKESQEETLKKSSATKNAQQINDASTALSEVEKELSKIMIPSIKFFTHEHESDEGKTFYCFILDSSYGIPTIYENSEQTAFERVLESNRSSGVLLEDSDFSENEQTFMDGTLVGGSGDVNSTKSFDIPIINIFSENLIIKNHSLTSETDEELQASLIKQMVDKNEQGDVKREMVSPTDMYKFLTTKISFSAIGNSAMQIYQPWFTRFALKGSIFERCYNITKLSHEIEPGNWQTNCECTICAV